MERTGIPPQIVRWLLRKGHALTLLLLILLLAGAFLTLSKPDLALWHHKAPKEEFRLKIKNCSYQKPISV